MLNIKALQYYIDAEEADTQVPQHTARMLLRCVEDLDKRLRELEEGHLNHQVVNEKN